MDQAIDILSWACLLGGSFFMLVGAVGVLRMPDVYTRSHAAGITDTLGALLILVGLMFQAGFTLVTVKLIMILVFLLFTSPTASHALNHTAWTSGLKPILDDDAPVDQPGKTDGKE
jgi:multicomponent Na+:H+ antiporter subunit G